VPFFNAKQQIFRLILYMRMKTGLLNSRCLSNYFVVMVCNKVISFFINYYKMIAIFTYLEDWYKHRGAAQAKLQFGVQGINQNAVKFLSHPTPKTLDLRCKKKKTFFIFLRIRVTLCAEKCMTLMNTLSRKTQFRLARILCIT
jgi:hypothetical protein